MRRDAVAVGFGLLFLAVVAWNAGSSKPAPSLAASVEQPSKRAAQRGRKAKRRRKAPARPPVPQLRRLDPPAVRTEDADPHAKPDVHERVVEQELEAFTALDMRVDLPEDATPEERDAALDSALDTKRKALYRLEKKLLPLAASPDPIDSAQALSVLGSAYADMGDTLRELAVPEALTRRQTRLYGRSLRRMGNARYQQARDMYEQGLEAAAPLPDHPVHDQILDQLEALDRR